jgi:hypothetical protein
VPARFIGDGCRCMPVVVVLCLTHNLTLEKSNAAENSSWKVDEMLQFNATRESHSTFLSIHAKRNGQDAIWISDNFQRDNHHHTT